MTTLSAAAVTTARTLKEHHPTSWMDELRTLAQMDPKPFFVQGQRLRMYARIAKLRMLSATPGGPPLSDDSGVWRRARHVHMSGFGREVMRAYDAPPPADNSDFGQMMKHPVLAEKPPRKHKWKRQTRRSIGVKGITLARLKIHAETVGAKYTTLLEQWIAERLDRDEARRRNGK